MEPTPPEQETRIEYMATVYSEFQAEKLGNFCKANGIQLTLITESFFQTFASEKFRPSAGMKSICGAEWLANGLITMRDAYEFLHAYIRIHRLAKGPVILLNDCLKELFMQQSDYILAGELITLLPCVLLPYEAEEQSV